MSASVDIRELLDSWPYDPEHTVRAVQGTDGRRILQVRTPVGIEQYEMEGRPDGQRPHQRESVLDYYMERLVRARAEGEGGSFVLDEEECAELFNEGTLYYFRYLHLFALKDWQRTVRDTDRNLQLFDFVNRHAAREEDRQNMEKWRPYILRMNAIARAMLQLEAQNHAAALDVLREAIRKIEVLPELDEDTFKFERYRSLAALRELAEELEKNRPLSETERLERKLRQAVAAQDFERAAQLRDKIRELKKREEH
ncbi:MAG: UvrB/UvrC motif-containing protein [Planctomycetota bacterium]